MTSPVLGKPIRSGSEVRCRLNRRRPPQGRDPSAASRRLAPTGFRRNVHYHLRSPSTMKTGPKGEPGGRRRRTVEVLAGPDPWNKQPMGLTRLAIEAKIHRLRPEALP